MALGVALLLSSAGSAATPSSPPLPGPPALTCPQLTCPLVEQAPAGPWSATASLGTGFGFFYATHGRLDLAAGRLLWERLELEGTLLFGFASSLVGLEPALRIGVVFHLGRRIDFALVSRFGYAAYRLFDPGGARWEGSPVVGLATEVRLALAPRWELRLVPAAGSGYLVPPLWGVLLEPSVGLSWRF